MTDSFPFSSVGKPDDLDEIAWIKQMIAEGEASGFLDEEPEAIIEQIIAQRKARNG